MAEISVSLQKALNSVIIYFESVDGHSGFHTVCCMLHKNNTTDLNHNKFLQQINCGLPVRLKKIIKYI